MDRLECGDAVEGRDVYNRVPAYFGQLIPGLIRVKIHPNIDLKATRGMCFGSWRCHRAIQTQYNSFLQRRTQKRERCKRKAKTCKKKERRIGRKEKEWKRKRADQREENTNFNINNSLRTFSLPNPSHLNVHLLLPLSPLLLFS